jgi:hexokinase
MRAKTSKELFGFLAKQIETFLKEHHEDHFEEHVKPRRERATAEEYKDEHVFKLGFTFSFPVNQIGINRGLLIRWTKGFDIADAVGKDVCQLLQDEIDELGLPVKVAALVNDTVGTLMSRSYTSPGKTTTLLGAIFGTGTNGAYLEKLDNIKKPMQGDYDSSSGEMVVNTEWGNFDDGLECLPTTKYDTELDKQSVNPGIQLFEKRISGMFLGELLRLVVLDMNKHHNLFVRASSKENDLGTSTIIDPSSPLFKEGAVDSSILSIAEADNSDGLKALRLEIENILKVDSPSEADAQALKVIAHAIGRRAARLSAVAVGGIVLQSGRLQTSTGNDEDDIVDIGVDGSLVEFYPGFKTNIRAALRIVDGIGEAGEKRIRIGIAKDGSGVGAALIALVADAMNKDKSKAN